MRSFPLRSPRSSPEITRHFNGFATLSVVGFAIALLALIATPAPSAAAATAAELVFERQDLWRAREGGYNMYRIPAIAVTRQGALLAWCEARKPGGDWTQIDILFRRSADGGKTWSPSRLFVEPPPGVAQNPVSLQRKQATLGAITVNNPCPIVDQQTGAIHFLYCIEYARAYYMRSDDDGVTWTKPVEITSTFDAFHGRYPWRVMATGPGHGLQLSHGKHKGRLIVPVWLSLGTQGNGHRPNRVASIYSDDHGKSWKAGDILKLPEGAGSMNETQGVQRSDGRVMFFIRNVHADRRRLTATSPDGATGWSDATLHRELFDPTCMASAVRYDSKHILFSNPDSGEVKDPKRKGKRANLTVKLSGDDGKTWPIRRIIEPGASAYSDLAVSPDSSKPRMIYCLFERGGKHGTYSHISLARFNLPWLTQKP